MSKQKLRKIRVGSQTYLWTVASEYRHNACLEVLTIYQDDYKKSPIRLFFREEDSLEKRQQLDDECWLVSNVGKGILWKTGDGATIQVVNLNHPGVVAAIAKFALQNGWFPETMHSPMEIDYGFDWIEAIDFPEPRGDK